MSTSGEYGGLFRLDGRRAVVIGAGHGIGREAAAALAAHGAAVTCADLDAAAAEEAAAAAGPGATAVSLDVRDGAAVAELAGRAEADVAVITPATNVRKRILDLSTGELDRVVALNLVAGFGAIQAFGRSMVAQGKGSIVAFSSIRSLVVEPGQAAYAATKAALVQVVRTAAAEWGPSGVRVNAVAPGVVDTPLTRPIAADPAWREAYAARSALGRWADPSELAGAVVYLASDAASFVTGTVLFVDGGWTAIDGRYEPPA